jgi:hypothetical protein
MYTYVFRSAQSTVSATAGQFLPFFTIAPGVRPLRLRGIKFDATSGYESVIYALVIKRQSMATWIGSGSTITPSLLFTLDSPTPAFTALYSTTGGLNYVNEYMSSDKEVFLHASNPIGLTEWTDGDITSLSMKASDQGSLDIYVASPAASAHFIMSVYVEEGPFKGQLDLAGANTSAVKSR